MLPEPPDLVATVPTWKSNELFWIVKNGFKYTGMPAWVAQERDDEVWAIVAFLRKLPHVDANQYREMAGLEVRDAIPARALAQGGPVGVALTACSRCHGMEGRARPNGAFPRLDIQSADYLLRQLQDYAAGTRVSGIMQPVAVELDANDMRQLADYYSSQKPTEVLAPVAIRNPTPELGHQLATVGLPDLGIPPCLSCHTENPASRSPLYPAIAGQYASYIAQQLALFKSGKRHGTPASQIMSDIARRLTPDHIEAVSIYLADLPPGPAEGTN